MRLFGPKYGATAHNIAVHDGACAGQPVLLPHTHVNLVPRRAGDLAINDEVYDARALLSIQGPN